MDRTDCVVVGGGVIGLAVARELALSGLEVVVLESESVLGSHTSSRNSGVIHAGIYYPTGSLKARLCVEGKALLYDYCEAKGVAHKRLGKVIVATDPSQERVLEGYLAKGRANGVDDLRLLSRHEVNDLEPEVRAVSGLWSPSTGIVDPHELMLALEGDLEAAGGTVVLSSPVLRATRGLSGFVVAIKNGGTEYELATRFLVNAAGLSAGRMATSISGLDSQEIPRLFFARGHYMTLSGSSPFKHLVYPVPEPGGLGVHVTLDLAGAVRFGPDVEWVDEPDYEFDEDRRDSFGPAIRRYFPALDDARLAPGYVGVRPKLSAAGEPQADFRVDGPTKHGVNGLVSLYGIESPGLTASLALSVLVKDRLRSPI